jgi:hypothetical protein
VQYFLIFSKQLFAHFVIYSGALDTGKLKLSIAKQKITEWYFTEILICNYNALLFELMALLLSTWSAPYEDIHLQKLKAKCHTDSVTVITKWGRVYNRASLCMNHELWQNWSNFLPPHSFFYNGSPISAYCARSIWHRNKVSYLLKFFTVFVYFKFIVHNNSVLYFCLLNLTFTY